MADVNLSEFDITLVIKAPNQKICDQTVRCATQWTVKRLKQHLSQVYPSQPNESQQRIIYSGRLLHDHLTLKEILKHGVKVHTVHLVCPLEKSLASTSEQKTSQSSESSRNPESVLQSGSNPLSGLSEEELHSLYREYYVYVYQWYQQQLYQYFTNPRGEAPSIESPTQSSSTPQQPAGVNDARPAAQPPPAAPAAPPAIAAGPGAIGGEFDDENFERDWLDWFYYALRVAILIGLLNYYSSWTKILTAVSIIGVFTFYRFFFQRRNRAAEQQAAQPQQPEAARPAPPNGNEAERPANSPEGNENRDAGESNVGEAAREPVAEVQVSLLRKIMNSFYLFTQFCVTLITSLVPERMPPLELD